MPNLRITILLADRTELPLAGVLRINILNPVSIYDLQPTSYQSDTPPHNPSELDESRTDPQDYSEYEHRTQEDNESLYDQLVPPRLEPTVTQETYAYSAEEGTDFENPSHHWNEVSEHNRLLPPVTPNHSNPPITTPPSVERALRPFPQLRTSERTPTPAPGPSRTLGNLRQTFQRTGRRLRNTLQQPINQSGESSSRSRPQLRPTN